MGFDTVSVLNDAAAAALRAAGMRFAVRYLGSLKGDEVSSILKAGLALMPVTYSRASGWTPTGELGQEDGSSAVADAKAAGFPAGVTVWCDLEGCAGTVETTSAYVNAWAGVVRDAGFDPGLYVGSGQALDGAQLYALAVDRYWRSFSQVPDPTCGWSMIQLYKTVTVAGTSVDVDVIQYDYRARLPNWLE
jgi:hypothetical protein